MNATNLPDEWQVKPLGELLGSLESGTRPPGGVRGIAEGVPSIGGEHINASGGFNFESVRYVPRSFYQHMRRGHVRKGDVLIVKDGATTGKVAFVRDDFPFEEAVVNEHVFVCRADAVDPEYLFWFLYSPEGQQRVLAHFKGTAQGGINHQFAAGTLVPIAPIASQRRLAKLLGATDIRLTSSRARIASARLALARFREGIFAAAYSGRLTAQWRESHFSIDNAPLLLAQIQTKRNENFAAERAAAAAEGRRPVWGTPSRLGEPTADELSDLPEVPETWLYCRLGNLAEVVRGASPRPAGDPRYFGGDIPWITVAELTKDESVYLTEVRRFLTKAGKSRSRWIAPGTLLLTNSGATLGVPKITALGGCINDGSVAFVDIPLSSQLYLYYFLKSQTRKLRDINQGAAQPNLNTDIVKNIVTPLAPLSEQEEVVRLIQRLLTLADALTERIESASRGVEQVSNSILSQAFRGDLVSGSRDSNRSSALAVGGS